jgi:serine protease Do
MELGLMVQELKAESAYEVGFPNKRAVVVTDVQEGTPADEGGLRRGDLILEVNRQQVTNLHDFQVAVGPTTATTCVLFLIRRGEKTVYVALHPEE